MKRTVFLALFAISLLVFAVPYANASPASEQLVDQGRALLSNNANPTYSGILAANDKFKDAVTEDPNDPEANLFYAVTRILAFGLEQGSGAGIETLTDLFEAFGMPRSSYEYVEDGPPWEEPPEIYDHVVPPETAPSGEEVRAFLAGPFVDLLDAALGNLERVGSSFKTTLTAAETGMDHDVEIDDGDVFLFKSALYALKSALLIISAYDLDVDLRELAALGNAGVLQIQRDLLDKDKYQDLLKLLPTNNASASGTQLLSNARGALLIGIGSFSNAFDSILGEFESADPQDDELFYFEREADVNEARLLRKTLVDLKASLVNNQILTVNDNYESWSLNDGQGRWAYLSLERHQDESGQFFVADYRGYNECWNFIGCGGSIDNITVTGNNIVIETTGSSWFNFRIEGTLTGSAHFSGTYTASNPYNSWNGTITGDRTYSENEQDSFDFNRVFGNNNKAPLDIRAVLPEFCATNEIKPLTFPGDPVLNGIVPGLSNAELTSELELEPCFSVPTSSVSGTITCNDHDGNGNIFVWAFDGPDWRSARELGNAVIADPGSYTIEGLPIGETVYIAARWDADNNGVRTVGDFVGTSGQHTVVSGGTSVGSLDLVVPIHSPVIGDVNNDEAVHIDDAILALKVISNTADGYGINPNADVNSDGEIGLAEVIYILQDVVGLR